MWLWIAVASAQDGPYLEEGARENALRAAVLAGDPSRVRGLLDGTIQDRLQTAPLLPPDRFGLLASTGDAPVALAATLALEGGSLEVVELLAPDGGPYLARALADVTQLPRSAEPVLRALIVDRLSSPDLAVPDRPLDSKPGWAWELLADAADPRLSCWALEQRDAWLLERLRGELPDTCDTLGVDVFAAASLDLVRIVGDRALSPCGLRQAAQDGDVEVVDWLLDHGVDAHEVCPNGAPVLVAAATEAVVIRLLEEGLDPFDDDNAVHLRLASSAGGMRLSSVAVALAMLRAETDRPERREQGIALAWLVGGSEVEAFRPFLPAALASHPPGTLPGLSHAELDRAWTAAGGLDGLLAARGEAAFGDPIPPPCELPVHHAEARERIGVQRRKRQRNRRTTLGALGQVDEWRYRTGSARTEGWSLTSYALDVSLCPELVALEPLLPVLVGRRILLVDGRELELSPDPRLPSGRAVRVTLPR